MSNDLLSWDDIIRQHSIFYCLYLLVLAMNLDILILITMEELAMGNFIEMQHYPQHRKIAL